MCLKQKFVLKNLSSQVTGTVKEKNSSREIVESHSVYTLIPGLRFFLFLIHVIAYTPQPYLLFIEQGECTDTIFSVIALPTSYILSRCFSLVYLFVSPVRVSYRELYYAHERLSARRLAGRNTSWHVERVRAGGTIPLR